MHEDKMRGWFGCEKWKFRINVEETTQDAVRHMAPIRKSNQQPITECGGGDIAPYVFLCGDPARVPKIAASWHDIREVCATREYHILTGKYEGYPMTVGSTGIGGPSTAIVFEEMAKLGAKVFIRIGNSGALSDDISLGDYVITTGAIREDGTSRSYIIPEYPAVAHHAVVQSLINSAERKRYKFHVGVTWSFDGFYVRNLMVTDTGELMSMAHGSYIQNGARSLLADLKNAGVKNCEMEASTILTLASIFGLRAGCICTVSDRVPWRGPSSLSLEENMAGCIDTALDAMREIAEKDLKQSHE
jgi:uridine phosphorylase